MLKVLNVSAGYNGKNVIYNCSFELQKGENLSIIGPNGSGKTTLLRTFARLIDFEGDVLLEGKSIKEIKRKELSKKIAMLSQITQIYFSYTVYETILMGRYAHMEKGFFQEFTEKDKRIVEQVMKTVYVEDLKDRQIDTLSGGQLQRVFLARVLAQEPDIIILDEPTNHLDLAYQLELIDYLKNWSVTNEKTVIGVLHDINLAINLSDNILIMDKGLVVEKGNVLEILNSDILERVYKMDITSYMKKSYEIWERLKIE